MLKHDQLTIRENLTFELRRATEELCIWYCFSILLRCLSARTSSLLGSTCLALQHPIFVIDFTEKQVNKKFNPLKNVIFEQSAEGKLNVSITPLTNVTQSIIETN